MRLETAKEILELNLQEAGKKMPEDVKDALGLGIEALKYFIDQREEWIKSIHEPLPGETIDD